MSDPLHRSVTSLLDRLNHGQPGSFAAVVEAVYDDLRGIARAKMRQGFGRPLEALTNPPTALVHDVIMELREQKAKWQNQAHFFAIATRILLRRLGDYRDQRMAQKRGGGNRGATLAPESLSAVVDDGQAAVDLGDLFQRLHEKYPREAEVATLHVVGGFTIPQVAEYVELSESTVERDWTFARAWLGARLRED
ncbi:MAG: ECF-type sigma factor [Tepidisphaeraceae bacterium]